MSRIQYREPFRKNVQGNLKARFRLDAQGEPLFEDTNGIRHFQIELSLESPRARDIESVTYEMDDATYWDPVAVSDDSANDFTEEISSYGDFEVEVSVQIGPSVYKQRAWLSNLLEAGHQGDDSPAILDAIRRIKAN